MLTIFQINRYPCSPLSYIFMWIVENVNHNSFSNQTLPKFSFLLDINIFLVFMIHPLTTLETPIFDLSEPYQTNYMGNCIKAYDKQSWLKFPSSLIETIYILRKVHVFCWNFLYQLYILISRRNLMFNYQNVTGSCIIHGLAQKLAPG